MKCYYFVFESSPECSNHYGSKSRIKRPCEEKSVDVEKPESSWETTGEQLLPNKMAFARTRASRTSLPQQTDKCPVLAIFASRVTVSSKSTSTGRTSVMPTRNVNLTDELDRFVAKKVKTGRYENASEVVRAGLRTLEREEQQYQAKIAALRAAIDAGDASGIAEGNVFGRVRKALKLPVSPR